jgi:Ca2+-binding RTX toxin-like protein
LNSVETLQFSDGTLNLVTGAFTASTINGTAAADALVGGGGNDTLNTSAGADRFFGGGGTDTASYAGASAGVTVSLETGGTTGDAAGDSFVSVENLTGSSFNDTLTGDGGANVLSGGLGTDSLSGGGGGDTFQFSNDFTWQNTNALERGTGDQVSINGFAGSYDSFNGGTGTDTLNGTSGSDYISANNGATNLIQSVEIINAGGGDDVVDLSPTSFTWTDSVTVNGGDGNDVIWSDAGNDKLYGDAGNDTLKAAAGDDSLYGGSGSDRLYGGAGNDILSGGTGNDSVYGDSGSDMLLFGLGDGNDYFSGGLGGGYVDEIHLNIDPSAAFGSDWTLTLTSGSITGMGDNQIFLSGDAAGVITLKDGSTIQFDQTEQLSWGG